MCAKGSPAPKTATDLAPQDTLRDFYEIQQRAARAQELAMRQREREYREQVFAMQQQAMQNMPNQGYGPGYLGGMGQSIGGYDAYQNYNPFLEQIQKVNAQQRRNITDYNSVPVVDYRLAWREPQLIEISAGRFGHLILD